MFLSIYPSIFLSIYLHICLLSVFLYLQGWSCFTFISPTEQIWKTKLHWKQQHQVWDSLGQCGWCWRRDGITLKGHTQSYADEHTLRCTCDSTVMKDDSVSASFLLIMKPISHSEALFFCGVACAQSTYIHKLTCIRGGVGVTLSGFLSG